MSQGRIGQRIRACLWRLFSVCCLVEDTLRNKWQPIKPRIAKVGSGLFLLLVLFLVFAKFVAVMTGDSRTGDSRLSEAEVAARYAPEVAALSDAEVADSELYNLPAEDQAAPHTQDAPKYVPPRMREHERGARERPVRPR